MLIFEKIIIYKSVPKLCTAQEFYINVKLKNIYYIKKMSQTQRQHPSSFTQYMKTTARLSHGTERLAFRRFSYQNKGLNSSVWFLRLYYSKVDAFLCFLQPAAWDTSKTTVLSRNQSTLSTILQLNSATQCKNQHLPPHNNKLLLLVLFTAVNKLTMICNTTNCWYCWSVRCAWGSGQLSEMDRCWEVILFWFSIHSFSLSSVSVRRCSKMATVCQTRHEKVLKLSHILLSAALR